MRHAFLLIFFAVLIAACGAPAYVEVGPAYPANPGYIYTYSGGGCWADEAWYGNCPWRTGVSFGYYWYGSGHYNHRPGYAWPYRPHNPPPRTWHPQNGASPPVIRDHRH